jgi:hypothetical protein
MFDNAKKIQERLLAGMLETFKYLVHVFWMHPFYFSADLSGWNVSSLEDMTVCLLVRIL